MPHHPQPVVLGGFYHNSVPATTGYYPAHTADAVVTGYAQPTTMGYAQPATYLEAAPYVETALVPIAPSGIDIVRPAMQRNSRDNLLAGGHVISERVVGQNELLATGRLFDAEAVRDNAYSASGFVTTGLTTAPVTTTMTVAPMLPQVEYLSPVGYAAPVVATELLAPVMTTQFVR